VRRVGPRVFPKREDGHGLGLRLGMALVWPRGAPDMYSSRKARLCSGNFHSPRKPRVPMLKERMGGTEAVVAKREEAWRIVPSPPKVVVRSTFGARGEGSGVGLVGV